ncbi:hypothetical protein ACJWDR_43350 [Streptomyces tauricus]
MQDCTSRGRQQAGPVQGFEQRGTHLRQVHERLGPHQVFVRRP